MKRLYYLLRHIFGINALHMLLSKRCKPFVLCYHEVNEEELQSQLSALKKVFTVKNINELQSNDYGACAITLDDCLKRDAEIFYKVAESLSLPVTFYLPVNYSINEKPLPGDLIKFIIQILPEITFNRNVWKSTSKKEKSTVKKALSNYFNQEVKKGKDISEVMFEVLRQNQIENIQIPYEISVIGAARVAQMASSKFVTFESHSMSHPAFVNLSDELIVDELQKSIQWIQNLTRKKVKSICYPFGSIELTGKKVYELSKYYYENGVTLIQGVWDEETKFNIPRIGIYPSDRNYGMWSKIFHYQEVFILKYIIK
jgi:hypothetical protein